MKDPIKFEVYMTNEENEANNDNPSQIENKQYSSSWHYKPNFH